MIAADIQADSLPSFYRQLVAAQELAHGKGYCSHHAVIAKAGLEGGTYAELGVNQGATLACALLAGFRRVVGVDIALGPFRRYEGLFRAFGDHWEVREHDSRLDLKEPVDFLLIDSRHEVHHLASELATHGPNVRRWMLVHDTAKYPMLAKLCETWCARTHWTVRQTESRNIGWMLLERRA